MRLHDGKYLCPFCISSWDCDGPHIEEKDLQNFYERLHFIKEDLALLATETIDALSFDEKSDFEKVKVSVYKAIMNRVPS
jgi:hypothetical protein